VTDSLPDPAVINAPRLALGSGAVAALGLAWVRKWTAGQPTLATYLGQFFQVVKDDS